MNGKNLGFGAKLTQIKPAAEPELREECRYAKL